MDKILEIKTVDQYNKMYGLETLHPLVSVVDLSKGRVINNICTNFGFYAIFLKEVKCGDIRYGKQLYDYQEGTLVFIAPNQVSSIDFDSEVIEQHAKGVLFHPDLIHNTSLAESMKRYSFFSYEVNEALHLSEKERRAILDCFDKIQMELEHSIDNHSKRLITMNIELLLDYCMRFYERQFITRSNVNKDALTRFEQLLDDYFENQNPIKNGLPSVKYFADKVNLSPNYFGDLVKKETGKSAQENIHLKIIELAKSLISSTDKTISQIAYELGFQYPQHMTRLFKRDVGCTPNEYRAAN